MSADLSCENLFLIKSRSEWEKASSAIFREKLKSAVVLGLKNDYPYYTDEFSDLEYARNWAAFGIIEPGLSRYWINRFKEVVALSRYYLKKKSRFRAGIFKNDFFFMGIAIQVGSYYFELIEGLFYFFRAANPKLVYCDIRQGFTGELLEALRGHFHFEIRDLNGE